MATYTCIRDGGWDDGNTWDQNGRTPGGKDVVIIPGGRTVSVPITRGPPQSITVRE